MFNRLHLIAMTCVLIIMGACASIGRPEGGPRDETPPRFVRSNPGAGAINVTPSRIDIYFDENVKVDDPVNKVVVSPVQGQAPTVNANGRRVSVMFRDTLVDNATYTIDFSDAIQDLNEGNVLDGFAIDFSTGPVRDSLVIAGKVFAASNLEPAQGMLVGVHSNLEDSALTAFRFDRVAKTNQFGEFVIRNLAPGSYRVFAVNDVNRDYRWDQSEDVAFFDEIIVPRAETVTVTDTLRSSTGSDSIATRPGTRYLPNDILLTWFNENRRSQYLKSYTRPDSARISFELGAPSDTMPTLTIVNGQHSGRLLNELALLDRSSLNDTLDYWITDMSLASQDTILIDARYQRTDSVGDLKWTNDTLRLTFRRPKAKKEKKKSDDSDSIAAPPMKFLDFSLTSKTPQELDEPLRFKAAEPLAEIDPAGIRLEIEADSAWHPIDNVKLVRDSLHKLLNYRLDAEWIPGMKYRLTADSASVTGIYGTHIKGFSREFTTKVPEDYSTVSFHIVHQGDSGMNIVVQLLNNQDKPVAAANVDNATATFRFVDPGTYYARAFIDRNGNSTWDTGNIAAHIQPEDVYYCPTRINVKKNWDIEQTWDLDLTAVDKQKPLEITKNKPKLKAGDQQTDTMNDDEEYDPSEIDPFTGRPYGSDAYGRGGNSLNRNGNGSRLITNDRQVSTTRR